MTAANSSANSPSNGDRGQPPARLVAVVDAEASVTRFVMGFAAPADDEAQLCAPARLELSDGAEIELGMLCAPSPETWATAREVVAAEVPIQPDGELAATLVWGVLQIPAQPREALKAQVMPEVVLLKHGPVPDRALEVMVELRLNGLDAGMRVRIDGGAGNIQWWTPDGAEQRAQQETGSGDTSAWRFGYPKPGQYALTVDLVDGKGYWVATLATQPLEIAPPIDEPESAASPRDQMPSRSSGLVEVTAEASVPWLPFRYVRPQWAWARTYTQPGGAVISRYLALGTYLAVRQEVMAGGQLWLQTGSYDWIPASSVTALTPSDLRGVQLAGSGPEPEPEPEPEPNPDKLRKGVVTAHVLNVRSGPGVQNPVVAQLRYNAQVTIYAEALVAGAKWYRIGVNRWVHSGWIKLVDPDTPPPPAMRRGIVIADVLNVRARPGVSPDNPPVDRLVRGAQVQIYEEALVGGASWYRIGTNRWVHGGWIQLIGADDELQLAICPSPAADAAPTALPVGWVVTQSLTVRAEPGLDEDNPIVGTAYHNQALNILETRTVAGQRWLRIGPDRWVYDPNVGVARFKARPSAIRADERWVGVNLREQTVVAYEGDKPVYAALAATGLPLTPTVQGIFRTWWRLVSRKMAGGSPATGGYYYLEEVPWTLYFYSGYALHAAYWHDAFGRPRSHGCVNLSPYDAWWIFKWSEAGGPNSPAVFVYWE